MLDEVPVVMATAVLKESARNELHKTLSTLFLFGLHTAFGLGPHCFSCIPRNILTALLVTLTRWTKLLFWFCVVLLCFVFPPESITAVLLHVKEQGNKYSLEKQVGIAVDWDNTLVLAIHSSKNTSICAWLASSISTWPTKRSVRDKITKAH